MAIAKAQRKRLKQKTKKIRNQTKIKLNKNINVIEEENLEIFYSSNDSDTVEKLDSGD